MSYRGAMQSAVRCLRSTARCMEASMTASASTSSRQPRASSLPTQATPPLVMLKQSVSSPTKNSPAAFSFASSALALPTGGPVGAGGVGSAGGQVRCAASSAATDDGDAEPGTSSRPHRDSWSRDAGAGRRGAGDRGEEGPRRPRGPPQEDPTELLIFAKESFMQKKEDALPIPPNVREVLYKYQWDKLLVDVRRTTEMTVKGKQEKYTAMVGVGNLQGLFGLGMGSSSTAQEAVASAYMDAYSKLVYIPLYRGHTIYHHIDHKFHHMKMRLMPRREGWGVKASSLVTELCGLVGIKNISIKLIGRRNSKFFVAQCLLEALQNQTTSYDGIEGTGVYAREVFYKKDLPCGLQRGKDIP